MSKQEEFSKTGIQKLNYFLFEETLEEGIKKNLPKCSTYNQSILNIAKKCDQKVKHYVKNPYEKK